MGDPGAERARQAVLQHVPQDLDEDVVEYLITTLTSLVEEDDANADSVRPDFLDAASSLFLDRELSEEDASVFCQKVLKTIFGTAVVNASAGDDTLGDSEDRICCCRNLLLMYGGSPVPLLKNATLELIRGHRYGVVGANGTGKTTIMARIASKDIVGFPKDIRVVHLRHEAILKGVDPKTTAIEFARRRNVGATAVSDQELTNALREVGFEGEDLLSKAVGALSGGWQMRLALACAMMQQANLYLLDEPTNHLDADAVQWLADFINRTCAGGKQGGTALVVSHDAAFLNQICTDVIHFTQDAKLVYHPGNFDAFKAHALGGDEAKAQLLLEVDSNLPTREQDVSSGATQEELDRLVFPNPEKVRDPTRSENPVVLTLSNMTFKHRGAEDSILRDVNVQVRLGSRIAIVGKNGSGKSTLLSILAGRLQASGELWQHSALRVVYISQHHESQLAAFMSCTPYEYLQLRFKRGYDVEAPRRPPPEPDKSRLNRIKAVAKQHGKRGKEVEAIVSRSINMQTKVCLYEVKWKDLSVAENTFEKFDRLKGLCVEHLVEDFNQMMLDAWGEAPERPLSDKEIIRHLVDFGLPEDAARSRRISMLSSGQKSKLMFAASFWTVPHIVCLDEPTNYLDADTVKNLTNALRKFRGGYIVVSHNQEFVDEISDEIWEVADKRVTVRPNEKAPKSK